MKLVPVGTLATVQVPLTPVAPPTPEMTTTWPTARPCAEVVVIVGFAVFVTPETPPPTGADKEIPELLRYFWNVGKGGRETPAPPATAKYPLSGKSASAKLLGKACLRRSLTQIARARSCGLPEVELLAMCTMAVLTADGLVLPAPIGSTMAFCATRRIWLSRRAWSLRISDWVLDSLCVLR